MIEIIGLQIVLATMLPTGKFLVGFIPPVWLSTLRLLASGLVLSAYHYVQKIRVIPSFRSFWNVYMLLSLFTCAKYIGRYWALVRLPVAKMALMLNATPFVSALCSYVLVKERLNKRQWLAMVIGFCGIIPLIIYTFPGEQLVKQLFHFSAAEIVLLLAMTCHSLGLLLVRYLIRECDQGVLTVNTARTLISAVPAIFLAFLCEGTNWLIPSEMPMQKLGIGFVILIIVGNIIGHTAYFSLLKRYTVTFMAFSDFCGHVCSAWYGWVFLGEQFSWWYIGSAVIVLIGLYLFYREKQWY